MSPITLSSVSKTYAGRRGEPDRVAVHPLDLTIEHGEFLGLLGPNGSGKSTLMRMLVGIEALTTGEISPAIDAEFKAKLGVIFQHAALDPVLTVRENLTLAGTLHSMRGSELRERIAEMAEAFRVTDRLDSRVNTLSGGLARRADLARAMISSPDILVIDEATASLDQTAREEFMRLIREHRETGNLTVIMATHRPEELTTADRVMLMAEGKPVCLGSPESLLAELGKIELTVFRPSDSTLTMIRDAGHEITELGEDAVVFADRFDPTLISRLHESNAAMSVRPTDLASVYRHRIPRPMGAPA